MQHQVLEHPLTVLFLQNQILLKQRKDVRVMRVQMLATSILRLHQLHMVQVTTLCRRGMAIKMLRQWQKFMEFLDPQEQIALLIIQVKLLQRADGLTAEFQWLSFLA